MDLRKVKISIATLNPTRRIGYDNLSAPQALGIKFLISELKKMSQLDIIARVSSINLLLSNDRREATTEANLRSVHLNPALQSRTVKFESLEGTGAIFNRQAALLLIHFARYYADQGVKTLNTQHLDQNVGLFFLIVNDFLTYIDDMNFVEGDREHNLRMVAPHITRQYLFHHSAQERYSIPQSWLVFEGLKNQVRPENIFDISAEIEKSRSYNLEEYFSILTILYCYWSRQTFEKWDSSYVVINPKTVFSQIAISSDKYLKILDSLSVNVCPSSSHPSLSNPGDWRREIYEQFELRLKPLIKINDVYICSDIEFVKAAFWNGPYHTILTDYPKSKTAKKMMDHLGDTTELFVRYIGKDAFGARFVDIVNKANNPLGDGVIKISDDWIVIVESKAARPGIHMVSGDKPITELTDFKKLIKDGLSQMSDRVKEYREIDGFKGRITPFLITAGHIPQHELIWDLMEAELNELFIMTDTASDFPFVMDLEAWNVICAAEKTGTSVKEIIIARNKDRSTKTSSPNYFLYRIVFNDQNREEPPHRELLSLFEDRVQILSKELFEKTISKRKSEIGVWRKLFNL